VLSRASSRSPLVLFLACRSLAISAMQRVEAKERPVGSGDIGSLRTIIDPITLTLCAWPEFRVEVFVVLVDDMRRGLLILVPPTRIGLLSVSDSLKLLRSGSLLAQVTFPLRGGVVTGLASVSSVSVPIGAIFANPGV
jgi:hypothetical protein